MKTSLLTLTFLLFAQLTFGQSYSLWVTGDSADVETNHKQSIVLAGGGGDHDEGMRWMLRKADGGDIVVIRASGSDGYNPYFYEELEVNVNSVTTIRFDSDSASFDPYLIDQIRGAEVLFIAGGDQTVYREYWYGTPIQEAINYLINEKQATVGGTSAGMAILGEYYYTPTDLGVTSEEALSDPFHQYMNQINTDDFIQAPILQNVITDTHFDQRERAGRTVTFMARLTGMDLAPRGIAANEYTAVGIDDQGLAWVFGDYPAYDDFVYFFQTNCDAESISPETMSEGQPLNWDIDGQALKVYKVAGNNSGGRYFDLKTWQEGRDGSWEDWSVVNGSLNKVANASAPCVVAGIAEEANLSVTNPVSHHLKLTSDQHIEELRLIQLDGTVSLARQSIGSGTVQIPLPDHNEGMSLLYLRFKDGSSVTRKILKM